VVRVKSLKALALLWCSGLVAADIGRLQQLADKNRFFELRRDLQQPGWNAAETLFYRAVIASRFGHETEGIELLQKVLATNPSPEITRKRVRKWHRRLRDSVATKMQLKHGSKLFS